VITPVREQRQTIGLVESGNMIKLSNLIKEAESEHENDRDMVTGIAEIIRMVNDMNNRKEIADSMLKKFNKENVIHNVKEFLTLCGL
jgi:hypothetical protein